jgi:hypothetical protein
MKIMKRLFLLLPVLAIIIAISYPVAGETKRIIDHKILNKSESGSGNLSIDVQVEPIDGRIPNETELEELSKYLAGKEKEHESISILFHLPDMESGPKAYASANHNSKIKARTIKYILLQHLLSN